MIDARPLRAICIQATESCLSETRDVVLVSDLKHTYECRVRRRFHGFNSPNAARMTCGESAVRASVVTPKARANSIDGSIATTVAPRANDSRIEAASALLGRNSTIGCPS